MLDRNPSTLCPSHSTGQRVVYTITIRPQERNIIRCAYGDNNDLVYQSQNALPEASVDEWNKFLGSYWQSVNPYTR